MSTQLAAPRVRTVAPRVVPLPAAPAWVTTIYAVVRRFCGSVAAGAVTLAAAPWSVPDHAARRVGGVTVRWRDAGGQRAMDGGGR